MVATLVDNQTNVTSKIRILNPFKNEVELRQNSVVGHAEPIFEEPLIIMNEEDPSEHKHS